jgi:hypothetical protein
MYDAGHAVREALFGNAGEARRGATAALALSDARDVEYGAAIALVLSGDATRAHAIAHDLETRFPDDTFVKFTDLPTLRALLALRRRLPAEALDLLHMAGPRDLVHKHRGSAKLRHPTSCCGVLTDVTDFIGHASAVAVCKMEQPFQTQTCYCSPTLATQRSQSWIPKRRSPNKPVRSASEFSDPSLSGSLSC